MTSELTLYSEKWGTLRVYPEVKPERGKAYITVYHKTPENLYRFYQRDVEDWERWSDTEVDWNNYLMGARNLRSDFEFGVDEWLDADDAQRLSLICDGIQELFDDDELFGYHVEEIYIPSEWDSRSDAELWEMQRELHARRGQLNSELREVERQYELIWLLGDRKYNWADRM